MPIQLYQIFHSLQNTCISLPCLSTFFYPVSMYGCVCLTTACFMIYDCGFAMSTQTAHVSSPAVCDSWIKPNEKTLQAYSASSSASHNTKGTFQLIVYINSKQDVPNKCPRADIIKVTKDNLSKEDQIFFFFFTKDTDIHTSMEIFFSHPQQKRLVKIILVSYKSVPICLIKNGCCFYCQYDLQCLQYKFNERIKIQPSCFVRFEHTYKENASLHLPGSSHWSLYKSTFHVSLKEISAINSNRLFREFVI